MRLVVTGRSSRSAAGRPSGRPRLRHGLHLLTRFRDVSSKGEARGELPRSSGSRSRLFPPRFTPRTTTPATSTTELSRLARKCRPRAASTMPQSLHRPPPTSASTLVTSPPTVASSSSGQPLPPPKSRPSLVSFQPPRGGPIPPSLKTTHAHLVYGAASPFRRRSLETERILFEGPSSSASGSGRGSRTSHTPSWREGGDGDGEREDEEGGEGEEGEDLSLHRHQRSSSSTGPSLRVSIPWSIFSCGARFLLSSCMLNFALLPLPA